MGEVASRGNDVTRRIHLGGRDAVVVEHGWRRRVEVGDEGHLLSRAHSGHLGQRGSRMLAAPPIRRSWLDTLLTARSRWGRKGSAPRVVRLIEGQDPAGVDGPRQPVDVPGYLLLLVRAQRGNPVEVVNSRGEVQHELIGGEVARDGGGLCGGCADGDRRGDGHGERDRAQRRAGAGLVPGQVA